MNDLFATNTAMSTPDDKTPKRKNNPELLRHTILVCTKNLMLDVGIGNLSMQKVADMAGTSKGGLFHHFKSKDELITSVVELFIAQINTAILADMDDHSDKMGAFTKAYIRVMFDNQEIGLKSDWSGLIRAMTTNVQMYGLWRNWLAQKIKIHASTDSNPRLSAIRCAVDGAWLNGIPHDELPAMRAYLLKLADDVH